MIILLIQIFLFIIIGIPMLMFLGATILWIFIGIENLINFIKEKIKTMKGGDKNEKRKINDLDL